jgi:hypothetical protein
MAARRRGKCKHCQELFFPDCRNRRHQRYCAKDDCRRASKAASQRRWLAKPENRDYFRGPENVQRVQVWRAAHPGYGRRRRREKAAPLQDVSEAQPADNTRGSPTLALQDVFAAPPLVLLGLIAHLMGTSQQEDIAESSRRLLRLGQDILGGKPTHGPQSGVMPGASAAPAAAVQLDREADGP